MRQRSIALRVTVGRPPTLTKNKAHAWATILFVDVKRVWSILGIQSDEGERQHMGNDAVCRCKGCIEYTVRWRREATYEQ